MIQTQFTELPMLQFTNNVMPLIVPDGQMNMPVGMLSPGAVNPTLSNLSSMSSGLPSPVQTMQTPQGFVFTVPTTVPQIPMMQIPVNFNNQNQFQILHSPGLNNGPQFNVAQ